VAAKTGTAQWSTTGAPHAWFTGFAPYEKPEIVITILVEEGVEGSTIAVPIAREVLDWYFTNRKDGQPITPITPPTTAPVSPSASSAPLKI
ncbi:MAG: penicillin-binding transpeptidase domain-containing protein, partial [Candidatus Falkowbacteria bacterium]|nr:penicillin-binding transpeptidase domain-containing protein [Candidatus Falkowbacteria bacterium]